MPASCHPLSLDLSYLSLCLADDEFLMPASTDRPHLDTSDTEQWGGRKEERELLGFLFFLSKPTQKGAFFFTL